MILRYFKFIKCHFIRIALRSRRYMFILRTSSNLCRSVSGAHGGRGGGGVTCHDFGYGCAAGVPEPHPIHILGQVKNITHSYTSHIEIDPIHILFFKIDPIHILFFQNLPIHILFGEKDTPLIYF